MNCRSCYDDLVGTHEIAEMAGVRKNVIVNWANRHKDFPQPVVQLAMGRAWSKCEIEIWFDRRTVVVPTRTIRKD